MNRILKAIVFLLATIYFLVDAIFLTVAKSLANWIAEHWIFESLRAWIVSLPPYPTLALFALPVAILEPVKPMAAYLVGTGHVGTGLTFLVVGEILKLVLVERLFSRQPRQADVHSRVRLDLLEIQRGKRLHYLDEGMAGSAALEPCRPIRHPQLCAEIKGRASPRRIIFQSR